MARSLKENERRLPLHPHHFDRIPDELRDCIYLEHGYGDNFGLSDDQLKGRVAGLRADRTAEPPIDAMRKPGSRARRHAIERIRWAADRGRGMVVSS